VDNKKRALSVQERIDGLLDFNEAQSKDDYDLNADLRRRLRQRKRKDREMIEEGQRRGIALPILDLNPDDIAQSKMASFSSLPAVKKQAMARRTDIFTQSIFQTNSKEISRSFGQKSKAAKMEQIKRQAVLKRLNTGMAASEFKVLT
jgi:hypothetical protein